MYAGYPKMRPGAFQCKISRRFNFPSAVELVFSNSENFHPKTAPEADLKPKLIQIPLYNPTQSNPEREIIIQQNNNSNQSPIVT